ncbi:WecB/TagA/CpsF family glycosyltransferase [Buttiauxella sp. WJP83]|uniref:WecB/TagA/CpsF family glycosyltransferase n=1 Tax=Buttiauxella sp. WJP83 TaxID=2986951 RepID=UPI0022DE82FA|nr:WecB/TagA/CpsF family glycosyltransferase [Buttiauxella sp. WJP83]WBM70852.1 WecB/TagA/CpsF family glycosyltransferase [Buttiauxella sp. WJP83]
MKILSISDYTDVKEKLITEGTSQIVSFVNPFSYYMMKENKYFSSNIDGFFVDGALLCLMHNIFNQKKIKRVSFDFSSIADDFFKFCENNNLIISIVGAKKEELEKSLCVLKKRYPALQLGCCRDGYFCDNDIESIAEKTINSDVVIIAMGAPRQEKVALAISTLNKSKLVITCGGFITQTSIKEDYYGFVVKKTGLRWLQRVLMHKHVRHKVIMTYPKFIIRYVFESLNVKIQKRVKS